MGAREMAKIGGKPETDKNCDVYHYGMLPDWPLEPQNQETSEFYRLQERRATDFEALKLWKGRSY